MSLRRQCLGPFHDAILNRVDAGEPVKVLARRYGFTKWHYDAWRRWAREHPTADITMAQEPPHAP